MFKEKLADLRAYACAEPGCGATAYDHWRLLCRAHYIYQHRHGLLVPVDPAARRKAHRLTRFTALVEEAEQCWLWMGCQSGNGYGKFNGQPAHRVAYELFKGAIPTGMSVDHLCRRTLCVRPDHLRLLTLSENSSDNAWARADSCLRGHPYTEATTHVAMRNGRPVRDCRVCRRERWAARRAAGGKH